MKATLTTVPQSSGFYAANFAGDSNYGQSGALVNVTVNIQDFNLTSNFSATSITAGNSATATIKITPSGNSASPVTLACPTNGGVTLGITPRFSPSTVNLSNGTASTSTLTISTLAPSTSMTTSSLPIRLSPPAAPHEGRPSPIGLLAAVCVIALLTARLRRTPVVTLGALACSLLLLAFNGGCGGGGGPVPSSDTLGASSLKVAAEGNVTFTATVTAGETPGGTVTFITNGFRTSSPVVGGVAQFQFNGIGVGIYTISAHYSGDGQTLPSNTNGSLNVVATGTTGVTVQGNTGGLIHGLGLNFTLQ